MKNEYREIMSHKLIHLPQRERGCFELDPGLTLLHHMNDIKSLMPETNWMGLDRSRKLSVYREGERKNNMR